MALERRGNGFYFYRKERHGQRVSSVYEGRGELAELIHGLDRERHRIERLEKDDKLQSFEKEKELHREIDQLIESVCENAKVLEEALYLINGYHLHSRQWRKRARNEND